MAVLNQCCCCCCSLRKGAIIIAVLYLIPSLIQIGMAVNSLQKHQYVDEEFYSILHTLTLYRTTVTKTQLLIGLLFAFINAVSGLHLLFGAIQENKIMLLTWVVVQTLVTVASIVIGIITCVALFMVEVTAGIIAVVAVIVYILFTVYFLLEVWSYYQTIHKDLYNKSAVSQHLDADKEECALM